ncbi:MAG: MerR family DNA-binding transcriptional regulator [Vicinamibacterales bacterium]
MAPCATDQFITVNEAAKILGLSAASVRLWENSGKLPAVRTTTGIRLFSLVEVQRVAAARGTTSVRD